MLEKLTLNKFKAFNNLESLEFKPITLLCGTNSCGKSSILQSILLLKQTIESKKANQTLLLNGRFVHLGSFSNIVYEKKPQSNLTLDYTFKIKKENLSFSKKRGFPMRYVIRDFVSEENFNIKNAEYNIKFSITLSASNKQKSRKYFNEIIVESLKLELIVIKQDNTKTEDLIIELKKEEGGSYNINWQNLKPRFNKREKYSNNGNIQKVKIKFSNLLPTSYSFPEIEDISNRNESFQDITYLFFRLNNLFETILSTYTYLGPLREEPSRRYIYEDETIEIGVKGENAAFIYLNELDENCKQTVFYDPKKDEFIEYKQEFSLKEALNKWLTLMGIHNFQPEFINDIINLNLNSNTSKKTKVNIADVGFGVSQIFPILLEGLRMTPSSTLLLEQPEIHLHPDLQMKMADYFISLAKSNKNVVVETHSDHIINRLVRRIVEDDTGELKRLISIYFISNTDSGSIYEEINIDDKQGITNWPIGFFDQSANELENILKAALSKRQK